MPRLFRRSQRYNVAKNCFLARIILLDNTSIEFNLLPEVTGADCLEKVAQVLDIQEISLFGLQYKTKVETLRWIDKDKPIRKQLEKYSIDGARNAELRFGVQFYVTNVTKLQYEITRYLYYLQLKHLVLNGHLQCSPELAVKLASYSMQAEFGDYMEQKHTKEFLSDYIFLPPSLGPPPVVQQLTDRASVLHQKHRAMSPAAAELMYIKLAQQLPAYGHEEYQSLDIHGSRIWIGASFIGVFVKHSNGQPTIYFKWPDIFRMKVRDKNFGIETPGETVYFKMPDNHTAQYVLRMMILQHKFYRHELESTPGLSWLPGVEGKKRSRSFHDLTTKSTILEHSHSVAAPGGRFKHSKDTALQRPLHMNVHTSDSEQLATASTISEMVLLLPDSNGHPHRETSPVTQQEASMSHSQEPEQQVPPDDTDFGPSIAAVDNGQATSPSHLSMTTSKYNHSPIDQPSSPVASSTGGLTSDDAGSRHKTSSDDYTDDTNTVEVFDIERTSKQKYKFTGSLEHLEARTPPRSLKVRTYSVEEQAEQDSASGTYDQRGSLLEKSLRSGRFYSEYEMLPVRKMGADISVGQKPENIPKNRYRDILPYEETRVKLNPVNNAIGSDYINASYVKFSVGGHTRRYIVAQGPMEHTCTHFWQMVWEQNVSILLMLTSEMEDGRSKCFRYFPSDVEDDGKQFDQYRVSRLFIDKTSSVISRGFLLRHIPSGQERKLTHLQYIDWPDHGIPDNPQPFINFLADVRSLRQRYDPTIPVLVHCSAGVGRSGVIVLVDMLIAMVDCGEPLDIPRCLKELRDQRMHLVQMVGQYKFVYSSVVQYIKSARLI